MLVTKNLPSPGMRKVNSMKIDPVNRSGTMGPSSVKSGIIAFRSTCATTTREGDSPFASAVRT